MTYGEELQAQLIEKTLNEQRYSIFGFSDDLTRDFMAIGVDPALLFTIFSAVFAGVLIALLVYKSICVSLSLLIGRFLPTTIMVMGSNKVKPAPNPSSEESHAN